MLIVGVCIRDQETVVGTGKKIIVTYSQICPPWQQVRRVPEVEGSRSESRLFRFIFARRLSRPSIGKSAFSEFA